ncbi:cytochrome C assembly family protein [Tuberibacillus sp. Marseille-P3662]|uniref:cytochrome C assembly family protein n=1 Tax=Tuberibacillus sp. Marseille-P3662 TaxID=1965358 RepID=UPI000A1CD983|nr:cytochrome c biogenesis protein CcsA [Tuberibacillus sp. Marseille-P3662]
MLISPLYDVTIIIYAMSVCSYFIDFLYHNRKANQLAFWLLSIVWVLQFAIFLLKMGKAGEFPILTPLDGLFFLSWILVTASLLVNRFMRISFFVFFINVVAFMIMAITLFKPRDDVSQVLLQHLMSDLLVIHITIAFLAYAAFTLSFILSMMYLIEYQMLKNKKWNQRLVRFDSLAKIEQLSFWCNLIGVPLLLISLILGMTRAYNVALDIAWYDPKVILSFVMMGTYSFYLYKKMGEGVHGRSLVFWNTIGFLLLLINIFLSETLTDFHLW